LGVNVKTEVKKNKVISLLDELPEEKLRVALDFVEYLRDKEEWNATYEVLGDKKIIEDIKVADKDWKEKRKENFTPWEKIKRNV